MSYRVRPCRLALATVGALLLAAASSAQGSPDLDSLFPPEVGNEWTYDYEAERCPHWTQGDCWTVDTTYTFCVVGSEVRDGRPFAVVEGPGGTAVFGIVEGEYGPVPFQEDLVVTNDSLPRVPDYFRVDVTGSDLFPLTERAVAIGPATYTLATHRKSAGDQVEIAPGVGLLYYHPTFVASGGRRSEPEWRLVSAVVDGQAYGLAATPTAPAPSSPTELRVYPNPTAGAITVEVPASAPGPVRVAVYDVLGREVAVVRDRPAPGRVRIEAAGLEAGAYVVRVSDARGERVTRFVVAR